MAYLGKHALSHQLTYDMFSDDFLLDAVLFGPAKPLATRSLDGFIVRMETVARSNLESFEEHTCGIKILRFGNVASSSHYPSFSKTVRM